MPKIHIKMLYRSWNTWKKDGSANLKYVYEVVKKFAKSIENDCVVVIKSTVPIGTNERVEKIIKEN